MSNELAITIDRGATVIRFVRPRVRNPLSIVVLEQLNEAVDQLTTDLLVFTGVDDVFASGADLREIASVTDALEFALRGQTLMTTIADLPQMTIAAVNGFCFGGALDLALACKRRIASPKAQFSHPGAGLGIITGWGGTQRLPRLIGQAMALEMFFTARRVSASEALAIGLVDQLSSTPLETALEFASV